ncbi:SRPBCC domain-containing protein [Arenibacter sp. F26102]|uniref:SRPBCC domain-containing protein n=1 Tax=Arenibacter sp. F26102 TaxID=2926416 RepID=UPI001FF10033|nr:SRPBCC domain-containing protein [Arenibacter sp. F26102]MCK0145919.1 SRPBCC domain-containing protein [Arenibacter sp. F26102]
MKNKIFSIIIHAPCERVWEILWSNRTYPKWTSIFSEGSRVETDWKEGSTALFLNAENNGMVSRIVANKPYSFMSIEHLGYVTNGVEDKSKSALEWKGAMENYTLIQIEEKTNLIVEMDITDEYLEYFSKTWPKALEKVKKLAEEH